MRRTEEDQIEAAALRNACRRRGAPPWSAGLSYCRRLPLQPASSPFCARSEPLLQQVLEKNKGKVKIVYKHFPLQMHPAARPAAIASLAAQEQGKFWEFHGALLRSERVALRAESRLLGSAAAWSEFPLNHGDGFHKRRSGALAEVLDPPVATR